MPFKQSIIMRGINGFSAKGVAAITEVGKDKFLSLSLAGLNENASDYTVYYKAQGERIKYSLSDRKDRKFLLPQGTSSDGAVLLSVTSGDTETGVLYGKFSDFASGAEDILNEWRIPYDDEVVATENYYEFDDNDYEKSEVVTNGQENVGAENTMRRGEDSKESEIGKNERCGEENFIPRSNEQISYYDKNKVEIEKLFKDFPEEKNLSYIVPFSKWAKIPYGKDKHYVVGIINDREKPRYICYGVPGKYGERPQELKNYCSFIPLSLFGLKSVGYWVMYQDALSGVCLKEE